MHQYDIIGDIHGHAQELITLLEQLGYSKRHGSYRHSERLAIFTGDFIDRGLQNEKVFDIVRSMVDSGTAYAVMGNHEYNAICYHTTHPISGDPLRQHSSKNTDQHQSFLNEFGHNQQKLNEVIRWFKELPLFIDLGDLRVVHAEWNQKTIDSIEALLVTGNVIDDDFIIRSAQNDSPENRAVETLLKGSEATLPNGLSFKDKDGHSRYEGRICWWENDRRAEKIFMVPNDIKIRLSGESVPHDMFTPYDVNMPPVFFGHYWLTGKPVVQSKNTVCVDYSVAKPGGKLCSYKFKRGESVSSENFCVVDRI